MPSQNILVQISIIYCMVHMLVLFFLFYEYRGSRKLFWSVTGSLIGLISVVCLWLLFNKGVAAMGQYGLVIGTLPTLLCFFVFAKERNAKFVFTFCLADTVNMWLQLSSGLLDYAVGAGGVVTFILRVVTYPILEYAVWRWLRRPFLRIRQTFQKGWLLFAALTGVCYVILAWVSIYPTAIFERPQDIPLAVLLLILVALTYATIFLVLFEQLHILEAKERQRVFEAQTEMMVHRVEDMRRAEEAMRIERHDMHHQLQTVASLAKRKDYDALLDYVGISQAKLNAVTPQSYCSNPILDAVLVSVAEQAEQWGIALEMAVALPLELPVDALELSIVFANALENAMKAVMKLPDGQRRITCKSVIYPRLMVEILNPYTGEVVFDRKGLPVSHEPGHGIGTRSIVAFAEKYHALCQFHAENGWFKVQLAV